MTRATPESLLASAVTAMDGGPHDHDALLDRIGDARFVLLGSTTHGTHDFSVERARITRRLVEEKGFDALVLEADWVDAAPLGRWVDGRSDDATAEEALRAFGRFPTWLWRNTEMVELLSWLRGHARRSGRGVGVYGMDLFRLHDSVREVVAYLARVAPEAAAWAQARLGPLLGEEPTISRNLGLRSALDARAVQQLLELRRLAVDHGRDDRATPSEELFHVEQHAHLVKSAAEYYGAMVRDPTATWNIRERHMADTLAAVSQHLDRRLGRPCKICVWAHSSHLGDARATELATTMELSVGQLMRERYARDVFLLGLSTHHGHVTAAPEWDAPAERRPLGPAPRESWEAVFHAVGVPAFAILPDAEGHLPDVLLQERPERAAGVVIRPETENRTQWLRARIANQFDAIVHVDETRAVEPLERSAPRHGPDAPETFPFAL